MIFYRFSPCCLPNYQKPTSFSRHSCRFIIKLTRQFSTYMTVIGKLYKDFIYIQRSIITDIRPFLVVPPTTDSWAFPKPRTAIRSPWWSCRSPLRHTRSFTATRPAAISWAAGPRAIENAAPIKQSSRSDGTVSRISRFSAAGRCTSDNVPDARKSNVRCRDGCTIHMTYCK